MTLTPAALQQLEYAFLFFFVHENWKYKVTGNMPFDKNIFTKKCTFLYNSCHLHISTGPTILVQTSFQQTVRTVWLRFKMSAVEIMINNRLITANMNMLSQKFSKVIQITDIWSNHPVLFSGGFYYFYLPKIWHTTTVWW